MHPDRDLHVWFGLGGAGSEERARALRWQHRLHWPMIIAAWLALVAFLLAEYSAKPIPRLVGTAIEAGVTLVFTLELGWMLYLVREKRRYLARNWLAPVIVVCGAMSLFGANTQWLALGRLGRLALVGTLLVRVAGAVRSAALPDVAPFVVGFAVLSLVLSGAGFYFLEPSVASFADGLWLAFVTGTTVGYGDLVPTVWPARFFAAIMVLVGFTLLSVVTASIVAHFLGAEEQRLRRETRHDILELRARVEELIGEEERVLRREMHRDIRALRDDLAAAVVSLNETQTRELGAIRAELDALQRRLEGAGRPR